MNNVSDDLLDAMWVHHATVTRYMGAGSLGDIYDDPAGVRAFVAVGERLYIAPDGRERLARGSVFFPADTPEILLGSEVTCAHPGLHGKAVQVTRLDGGDLGLPDHLEVVVA